MKKSVRYITTAAMIAAVYIVLCLILMPFGSSIFQVRVAEALTILPVFTPVAIPGLTIGCLLSNLISGCTLPDIIFGSLATLLGALGTYALHRHPRLAWIPPVVSNGLIVSYVLYIVTGKAEPLWLILISITGGELISCGLLGYILYLACRKTRLFSSLCTKK